MQAVPLKNWLPCKGIEIPRLYLIGGTVRDLFLGKPAKDIDLVCKGAKVFAGALARCRGAALVSMEKKPDEPCYRVVDREDSSNFLDIAEMRGQTIDEDLNHRDFTINAIAIEVKGDGSSGPVIDPLNGAKDILDRIIRHVSGESIVTDPLRILRAIRLAAALDFTIEEATLKEMAKRSAQLMNVSSERITAELLSILETPGSSRYVRQMDELGILDVIFPEITAMKGCAQNGYHHLDVWGHSMLVMENTENIVNHLPDYFGEWSSRVMDLLGRENRLPLLKLSALLHDAGKPSTGRINPDTGRITFYRHDEEGARIIEAVSERLKLSNKGRGFMVLLTGEHLHAFHLSAGETGPNAVMRWFRKTGDDSIFAIILSMADTMSSLGPDSGDDIRERHIEWAKRSVGEYYEKIKAQIESPDLVTGNDLIALGMKPGPDMGRILKGIRDARDAGEVSSREEALELAKKLCKESERSNN